MNKFLNALFILLNIFGIDAFAQKASSSDVYGDSLGYSIGFFDYLVLFFIIGFIACGLIASKDFRRKFGLYFLMPTIGLIIVAAIFGKKVTGMVLFGGVALAYIFFVHEPHKKKNLNLKDKPLPPRDVLVRKPDHLAWKDIPKNNDSGLIKGNINCVGCGYQDLPSNFLLSDIGESYRKCPKCQMHSQFDNSENQLRPIIQDHVFGCPKCSFKGKLNRFSEVPNNSDFLECRECN